MKYKFQIFMIFFSFIFPTLSLRAAGTELEKAFDEGELKKFTTLLDRKEIRKDFLFSPYEDKAAGIENQIKLNALLVKVMSHMGEEKKAFRDRVREHCHKYEETLDQKGLRKLMKAVNSSCSFIGVQDRVAFFPKTYRLGHEHFTIM